MYQNWLDTTGGSKGIYQGKIDAAQKAQADQDAELTKTYGYQFKDGKPVLDAKGNPIYTLEGQKVQNEKAAKDVANQIAMMNATTNAFKAQTDQDKVMTASTGIVYWQGKPMTDKNGKPISSLDFQKFTSKQVIDTFKANETARHNQTTEAIQQQNANTTYTKAMAQIAKWQKDVEIASKNSDIKSDAFKLAQKKYDDGVAKTLADLNNKDVTRHVQELQKQRADIMKQLNKKGITKKQKDSLIKSYNDLTSQITDQLNKATTGK
jgi:hypothetical protein